MRMNYSNKNFPRNSCFYARVLEFLGFKFQCPLWGESAVMAAQAAVVRGPVCRDPQDTLQDGFPESPFIVDRTHSMSLLWFLSCDYPRWPCWRSLPPFLPPFPISSSGLPRPSPWYIGHADGGPPVSLGHQQKRSSLGDFILSFRSLTTVSGGLGSSPAFWGACTNSLDRAVVCNPSEHLKCWERKENYLCILLYNTSDSLSCHHRTMTRHQEIKTALLSDYCLWTFSLTSVTYKCSEQKKNMFLVQDPIKNPMLHLVLMSLSRLYLKGPGLPLSFVIRWAM